MRRADVDANSLKQIYVDQLSDGFVRTKMMRQHQKKIFQHEPA